MIRTEHPHRPSRRTVLAVALAAGGAAGLASCRGRPEPAPERVPASLGTAEMSIDPALMAPAPVPIAEQVLAPHGDRPVAYVLLTRQGDAASALAVTVAAPAGHAVPVAPETVEIKGWGREDAVLLLAERPDGGALAHDLHVSADLATWSTVPVTGEVPGPISAASDGILAFRRVGGEIPMARIGDDGVLTPLGAIAVPEGERWSITAIAVRDRLVVAVGTRPGGSPIAVTSADGGATWGEAVPLTTGGSHQEVSGIVVQGGTTFVVTGTHEVDPGEIDGTVTYTHPVAWSSADGARFAEETIPLPVFGLYQYEEPDGTPIPVGRPWAGQDYVLGAPVLVSGGREVAVGVGRVDTYATSYRARDGSWVTVDGGIYLPELLRYPVVDAHGAILRTDELITTHPALGDATSDTLVIAPHRWARGSGDLAVGNGGGTVWWRRTEVIRRDMDVGWVGHEEAAWFRIDGGGLTPWEDLPVRSGDVIGQSLLVADDGAVGMFAEGLPAPGTVRAVGAQGWLLAEDGTWTSCTGLPDTGSFGGRGFRHLGGTYYLCGATSSGRERSVHAPWSGTVWTSPDALTWTVLATCAEPSAISDVGMLGDELIAVGTTRDEAGDDHAAILRREGEVWRAAPLTTGASRQDVRLRAVGGELLICGDEEGRGVQWRLDADGTASESYRSNDDARRGAPLDLGSGVLLAAGWRREHSGAVTGTLWASIDDGGTWDPTAIPGQAGRDDDVDLVRDGEDVIVIVSRPEGPRAHRIVRAAADARGRS